MKEPAIAESPSLFGQGGISITNYLLRFDLLIPILLLLTVVVICVGLAFLPRCPGKRFLLIYSYVSVLLPLLFVALTLFHMMKTLIDWDQGALGRMTAYATPFCTIFAETFLSALIGIGIGIILSSISLWHWLRYIKKTEPHR